MRANKIAPIVFSIATAIAPNYVAAQEDPHYHHPAEVGGHEKHYDEIHEAYMQYERALTNLCKVSVKAMHDHASEDHGATMNAVDLNMAIANCINAHQGDHNDVIQDIYARIHEEVHVQAAEQ